MPHLDGLEVLEKLNKMDIDPMPFIIISSAISDDEIIHHYMYDVCLNLTVSVRITLC